MGRKGIPLLVYLDNELSAWLRRMHDEEGYPKAALVRIALRECRARYERRMGGRIWNGNKKMT